MAAVSGISSVSPTEYTVSNSSKDILASLARTGLAAVITAPETAKAATSPATHINNFFLTGLFIITSVFLFFYSAERYIPHEFVLRENEQNENRKRKHHARRHFCGRFGEYL
ncbi:unknown [Acidiphilium sp. CAG:727]|nr:unknown [Acidiphilium sp. CAG:727]